ncbi:MAG TPA: hypothetical protein VLJ42_02695 [Solirubrobacteraceae bacterium]|nr:hypothetical protein [Solirubrobacteraceae bacterium]
MRARIVGCALLVCALSGASASIAAADFGVSSFQAGTCVSNTPKCTYSSPPAQFYTQAAGHPQFGITDFAFKTTGGLLGGAPDGNVKDVRVDLPPGLSTNPEALPKCAEAQLAGSGCPANTQVGTEELTGYAIVGATLSFPIYNMVPPAGRPAEFGIRVQIPLLVDAEVYLVGGISWNSDYHEYFTISDIPNSVGLIESRLIFNGQAGDGTFLTMPSTCSGPQTTTLQVDSYQSPGQFQTYQASTPVGADGCGSVPFHPTINVTPETTQADTPDGVTVDLHVPQNPGSINSANLEDARVALPVGMSINPPGASGLQFCTDTQLGIGSTRPMSCPAAAQIGSLSIATPVLPEPLSGAIYLGEKQSDDPASGQEYRIFLDAESPAHGISVRLQGAIAADPDTGRLTATFADNPQVPFSDFILRFNPGAHAPLANPLSCGAAQTVTSLTPYTGEPAATPLDSFLVDSDGHHGACPVTPPFQLTQSTPAQHPATAGAYSPFTLNLARADGQQYLGRVSTQLPPGLLGAIPSVALCGEPRASQGTCAAASKIGTATVTAGAGPSPYAFSGDVFLTGPYGGAPYGLTIAVPAVAGPYNLGTVVARATINVDPHDAHLIIASSLPTIFKGIPLRLRTVSIAVDRHDFIFNPTSCAALATTTALTSTGAATQTLSSPFQVGGCQTLAFHPGLGATTDSRTSRANGASLDVKVTAPAHEANIRSVSVVLPKQLPARLTTIQQACLQATFAANPRSCPAASLVGQGTASTPVLPAPLSGPAYLVSHGGAGFPSLEILLSGNGVNVDLSGSINISSQGVTSSTFAAVPDVPISSFELSLPAGPHSALAANGKLCGTQLRMPTTIVAHSGAQLNQSTLIAVTGGGVACTAISTGKVKLVRHRVTGHTLTLTVQTPSAGRVRASGNHLEAVKRKVTKATRVTLKVKLTNAGLSLLRTRGQLKLRVRVGFTPVAAAHLRTSKVLSTVRFKR